MERKWREPEKEGGKQKLGDMQPQIQNGTGKIGSEVRKEVGLGFILNGCRR